ncbi:MAG TPA: histidine kinase dimerization/phospho-acceptor domain-containing protein [Candidatus Angelobacter sp.]|nr:histidine kinase dimerization/phospho-acceptor domain-containing protein [Candidatus Angelobacter sp.]
MALTKKELIRELKHQINSPLAAIRNALYLAAVRADDPEIERYLKLADNEVSRIARVLREADQLDENKSLQICSKWANAAGSAA